jgi:hypothetical protein
MLKQSPHTEEGWTPPPASFWSLKVKALFAPSEQGFDFVMTFDTIS